MLLVSVVRRAAAAVAVAVAVAALLPAAAMAQVGNASDVGGLNTQGLDLAGYTLQQWDTGNSGALLLDPTSATGQAALQALRGELAAGQGAPGGDAINALLSSLTGIATRPNGRFGATTVDPQRLAAAVTAFNQLVQQAGAPYLQNPPAAFQQLYAFLAFALSVR